MTSINGGEMPDPDAKMFIEAAIAIGKGLCKAARPLFVAWCKGPMDIPNTWGRIADELGVGELDESALLFAEWGDASERDDFDRCDAIENDLERAGQLPHFDAALAACIQLAGLLPSLLGEKHERRTH